MMFKRVIFWSEFPKQVNWKRIINLIQDKKLNIEIYLACKTRKEFDHWKKKIKSKRIKLGAWPILTKKDGYWFSGHTSIKNITSLQQFSGLNIKIDLEPPIPKWQWSNFKMILYLIKLFITEGKNNEHLKNIILEIAKNNPRSTIIMNEFPLWKGLLKKHGIFINQGKNLTKNIMCYTTVSGRMIRPLIRKYLSYYLKYQENPQMYSIGLLGPGILGKEGIYNSKKEFEQDLKMITSAGSDKIAIYSVEGLLKREQPEQWLKVLKQYVN